MIRNTVRIVIEMLLQLNKLKNVIYFCDGKLNFGKSAVSHDLNLTVISVYTYCCLIFLMNSIYYKCFVTSEMSLLMSLLVLE